MPQPRNKQIILSSLVLLHCLVCNAQPFVDIGKVSYFYTPAGDNASGIRSQLYSINVTLPVELKKCGDVIILNPFFDRNDTKTEGNSLSVSSTGFMAGFLKKEFVERWDLMTSIIIRTNHEAEEDIKSDWQTGGLVLATFKQHTSRSFKFGMYYNREFFGNFFMPLIGIDWKINERTNLFGVLPGSMVLERKANDRFYFGASFRALTNSYRLRAVDPCVNGDCSTKYYLRINDNQLGIFGDVYLLKRIAFSAEAGHTIIRKYRFGYKGKTSHTYTDLEKDQWYIKGTLSYRIRFR